MKRTITYMALGMAVFWPCLSKVALAGTVSGSGWTAETKSAPAMAFFNGNVYFVWKGASSGDNIWYSFGSSSQQKLGATTSAAPAATATASAVYVAWRGESDDDIHYATSAGSGFAIATQPINNGLGTNAETAVSPALASNGSTVYAAWTTASDTILFASNTGGASWSFASAAVPGASTALPPALTVYSGSLYLAWVEKGTSNVMYASLPLSGGSWSSVGQVKGTDWSAQTSVAPALGVSSVLYGTDAGLYVAWTAANSTETEFTINYSQFTGSEWNGPILIPNPPDPAPANTAPALLGYTFSTETETYQSFAAAYMTTSDDIEYAVLQARTFFKKPSCPCPDCCS